MRSAELTSLSSALASILRTGTAYSLLECSPEGRRGRGQDDPNGDDDSGSDTTSHTERPADGGADDRTDQD
jgi:hypothetical protein